MTRAAVAICGATAIPFLALTAGRAERGGSFGGVFDEPSCGSRQEPEGGSATWTEPVGQR